MPGSVECERWTSDSVRVSGRVQNTGTTSTSLIEVQMVVRDGSSEVARDTTYADQSELGRGGDQRLDGVRDDDRRRVG